MMASKSVNDIASVLGPNRNAGASCATGGSSTGKQTRHSATSDYTSDPNLCERSPGDGDAAAAAATAPVAAAGSGSILLKRRPGKASNKDPERRKSLISYVSDLFSKKKSDTNADATATTTSNEPSMFGRFRISPKSKSKVGASEL